MKRLIPFLLLPLLLSVMVARAQLWQPVPVGMILGGGGGGGCSQATTYLARVSGENTSALTTLICGLVTDGVITGDLTASTNGSCGTVIDRWFIGAMANQTDALLDVCNNTTNPSGEIVTATFTANAGFFSSSSGVDTLYTPSTGAVNYTLNDASISIWSLTDTNVAGSDVSTGSAQVYVAARYSDNNDYCSVNDGGGGGPGAAVATGSGFYVCERTGSSASQLYKNASLHDSPNVTSTTVPTQAIIFGENTSKTIAMFMAGKHLTTGQISSIDTRFCAYLTTVFGSCPR